MIKENEKVKKLDKEIKDSEEQLSIQEKKLKGIERNLANDRQVLTDYQSKLTEATKKADISELRNLNTSILDLEREIEAQVRMQGQMMNVVASLKSGIKEQKEELRDLLTWIVKLNGIQIEYAKAADLLDRFLDLNKEFVDSVHTLFDKYGLKRLDSRTIALGVKGNYGFMEHLSLPKPLEVVNVKSHQEHYDRQVKKLERIISGKKKPPKPKKPDKQSMIEKISDTVKSVAAKVKPEEMDEIFS